MLRLAKPKKVIHRLEIAQYTFTVKHMKGKRFKESTKKKKRRYLLGECDTDKNIIRIAQDMNRDEWNETLLHEILHATLELSGNKFTSPKHEETLVNTLSPLLYQVLKTNKLHF